MIYGKIKALCKKSGISIHKLEMECGIGNGIIHRWKSSTPSLGNLQKVAQYFDVSIEFLLKE